MHELATNATKYGALSASNGRLSVEWNIVRRSGGEAQFSFLWAESDGPPVMAPKRRGFGLRAVERLARASDRWQRQA
jgi:two-component sensor histidine kinase